MDFIINTLKGIVIGAGAILPGISSGVLLVIFGIYQKLIDSILGFFKDIRKNFKFLFPIAFGAFIGIVLFGNIINFLFTSYPTITNFSFIGFILGTIPILFKEANNNSSFKPHYLIYTIITFTLTLVLLKFETTFDFSLTSSHYSNLYLMLCGLLMSIGIVVPGVSSTAILMILGIYPTYLLAISTVDLQILIPFGIGLVIGGLIFLFIIKFLLKNYFSESYYGIIGFVLGSIFIIFPGFTFDLNGVISLIFFSICFVIAYNFEKKLGK